jgi:Ca2+-binding RTX toxin-like protein
LQRGHSDVEVGLSAGDWIGFFILPNGFGQNGETLESGTYVIRDANGDLASVSTPGATTLFRIDPVTGAEIPVQSQYGTALFHSAADPSDGYALNPDSYPHTVGHVDADNGTIVIGFEDLWNGGDRDYDDVVLSIDVGLSNASVLDPNIVAPDSADDGAGWVYGEDGQRYDLDGNPLASENDVISGGSGDDRILGMAGHDTLEGGRGNDSLNGNSGDDTLRGDGGRDELSGGRGEDVLHGGDGNDLLDGNSGDDWLSGGRGNDTLTGSSGDDTVFGGSGSDTGSGGSGDDDLFGESGNDTLSGGSGHDQIEGGSGSDVLDGGQGDDSLSGGSGADRLKGGSGDDSLIGGDGKDYLNGGSGDDILDGGAGNDRFYLGEGNDHVTGGTGSDRFVFRADGQGATTVVISDYRHQGGELDTLDLRALDLLGSGLSAEDWIAQHVTLNDDSGVSVDLGVCNVLFEARPDASASNLYDEICDGLLFF